MVAGPPHHKGWHFVCAWTCAREVDVVQFSSSYCGAKQCLEMMGGGPADSWLPLPPPPISFGCTEGRGGRVTGLYV